MTGNSNKLRSLFLAALMVFSVFAGTVAFSGAAAAANNPTISSATEFDSGNVEVTFNETVEKIDHGEINVWLDGTKIIEDGDELDSSGFDVNSGSVVNDEGSNNQDAVYFQIQKGGSDFDVTPNRNLTVEITGVTATVANPNTVPVSSEVVETSQDVDEGGSDQRTYQGERVALVANDQNTQVVIEGPNGVILDGNTGDASRLLTRNTENLELGGTYQVDFGADGDYETNFSVNNLQLTATAQDTQLTTGQTITVDVSAIRGPAPLTVNITGPEDVGAIGDDGYVIQKASLDGTGEATVTFATQDTAAYVGNYTVTVVDNKTGIDVTTETINVERAQPGSASFGDIETDQRGDVVEIPVELTNTQYATVTLGSKSAGFMTNVSVEDGDGDGVVTLQWNSFLADEDVDESNPDVNANGHWSVADSDDSITGENASTEIGAGADHVIAAGTYELSVASTANSGLMPGADATALDSLRLEPRPDEQSSLTLWTAPTGTSISDLEDLQQAQLTQTSTVAEGDVLVAQVNVTGISGVLATMPGNSLAEKLEDASENNAVPITGGQAAQIDYGLVQVIAQSSNLSPTDISLGNDGIASEDITVLAGSNNDTYYIVQEMENLANVDSGQTYDTQFNVTSLAQSTANFGLVAPNADGEFNDQIIESQFDVSQRSVSVNTAASGMVEVRKLDNQTISGTTSLAPGTQLTVRLQSTEGATSQFVIGPRTTTVQADGTWSIEADFSGYNANTEFNIRVSAPDATGDSTAYVQYGDVTGTINAEPQVQSLTFQDQSSSGDVVTVEEVELNANGFVAIHTVAEDGSPGEIIGAKYVEQNTLQTELRVLLDTPVNTSQELIVMPHLDSDGNGQFNASVDEAFMQNGQPVTASAMVSVDGEPVDDGTETQTPPQDTETPPQDTETPPPADTTTEDDGGAADTTAGESGPGFGMTVAVLALLGAALLAARRNE